MQILGCHLSLLNQNLPLWEQVTSSSSLRGESLTQASIWEWQKSPDPSTFMTKFQISFQKILHLTKLANTYCTTLTFKECGLRSGGVGSQDSFLKEYIGVTPRGSCPESRLRRLHCALTFSLPQINAEERWFLKLPYLCSRGSSTQIVVFTFFLSWLTLSCSFLICS